MPGPGTKSRPSPRAPGRVLNVPAVPERKVGRMSTTAPRLVLPWLRWKRLAEQTSRRLGLYPRQGRAPGLWLSGSWGGRRGDELAPHPFLLR